MWLLERAGLDLRIYRIQALQRRLPACLRALRVTSTEQARAMLEHHPELLPRVISAVLIGASEFFRDPGVFDCLGNTVLPELLQTRPSLRVYSAGCSQGQELYSVAMLLDERGSLDCSHLLGMDCRADAIAGAQAGVFEACEVAGVSPCRRQRYFQHAGSRLVVVPSLREKLHWCIGDLLRRPERCAWDVILFRNVSIYLDHAPAALLWERLVCQLAPGGILVTGKAERPAGPLPLVRVSPCVYRKTSG